MLDPALWTRAGLHALFGESQHATLEVFSKKIEGGRVNKHELLVDKSVMREQQNLPELDDNLA